MKKRVLTIILISLTIALATYTVRVINFASSYYGKPIWIQYASYILAYTLPFLIIGTFFTKLTKIVAGITTLVLILCITFGLYLVGIGQMLSHYLLWTISYLISITYLIITIYKDNQIKTADT
jgi:hypothetical protein